MYALHILIHYSLGMIQLTKVWYKKIMLNYKKFKIKPSFENTINNIILGCSAIKSLDRCSLCVEKVQAFSDFILSHASARDKIYS